MTVDDTPDPLVPGPRHEAPTPLWPDVTVAPADVSLAATAKDLAVQREWNLALGARIDTVTRVAYTAFGVVFGVLLIALVIGYFTHRQSQRIDDLDAARLADTTQQATVSTQQHAALCDVSAVIADIPRAAWPGGVAAYDRAAQTLRRDTATLRCAD